MNRECQDACSYSTKPVNGSSEPKEKAKTQERINRLEALVLDLARRTPESLTSSSAQEAEATRSLLASAEGAYVEDAETRNYTGATNFSAILNSVSRYRGP